MSHADDGRLSAFLDGELDDAASAELERHLQDCAACAARLDEVARVRALATSLVVESGASAAEAPAWSELLTRAAHPTASASAPSAPPRRRSLLLPGLAWAATLVLAFAIGWQARQADLLQPEAAQFEAPSPAADAPVSEETVAPAPAMAPAVADEMVATAPAAPPPTAASPPPAPAADEPFESIDVGLATERLGAVPLLPPQAEIHGAAIGPGNMLEGWREDREVLQLRLAAAGGEVTLLQQYEGAGWAAAAPAAAAPEADADLAPRRAPEMARLQAAESTRGASRMAQQAADQSVELLEAAFSVDANGTRRLRWRHAAGYLLVLESAQLDETELLALARSLR